MNGQPELEIQVIGPSLDEIKEALDLTGNLAVGSRVPLPKGATLRVDDVSKSSGFDATTVILTAMVSVATSTSSALLIEWLKSRLFKSPSKASVTILINGKELEVQSGPGTS
jgi:hypothetical protein